MRRIMRAFTTFAATASAQDARGVCLAWELGLVSPRRKGW